MKFLQTAALIMALTGTALASPKPTLKERLVKVAEHAKGCGKPRLTPLGGRPYFLWNGVSAQYSAGPNAEVVYHDFHPALSLPFRDPGRAGFFGADGKVGISDFIILKENENERYGFYFHKDEVTGAYFKGRNGGDRIKVTPELVTKLESIVFGCNELVS